MCRAHFTEFTSSEKSHKSSPHSRASVNIRCLYFSNSVSFHIAHHVAISIEFHAGKLLVIIAIKNRRWRKKSHNTKIVSTRYQNTHISQQVIVSQHDESSESSCSSRAHSIYTPSFPLFIQQHWKCVSIQIFGFDCWWILASLSDFYYIHGFSIRLSTYTRVRQPKNSFMICQECCYVHSLCSVCYVGQKISL